MLKNGPFWELLRIFLLVILLCLNLDDVDGGLPRMGPRFSRPISSPTISKYPKRRPLAKKPKLPAEPPGFKSVADHPLSHYLPKDEVRKMLNVEASAEFKKIIDKTKINGHPNGKEINNFGNLHNGPNLPSPSTSNGFSRHPYDNEARRSPSTTPNRFNRPPATDQSNHPELFGGSHRDAAPVRVMDTNGNTNKIGESAPAAARRNWETFDDEPEQRPRNNRQRSIDEHDEMQMPSTSNDDTYHWEWLERNQPGNLERFKKFYKDATKINDKPTVKKDIGELAFSLIPENDEQFSAMVYGGSRLPNALLGEDEDMREFLARRAAVRFGVRGVKEGINALLPAENAESIMDVAGPFAGAAAAPIISRSVGRGFKGYERYKKRGQLPWQKQENQKTLGIDKYLYDFEKGTLRKATDPKNLCPYVARCAIVGSGTLAGGTIGTAAGPPGMLVGGVIGNKVAERFVSAPVEEGIRRQFRRRRQFDYKKLRESLSLDDDEGSVHICTAFCLFRNGHLTDYG